MGVEQGVDLADGLALGIAALAAVFTGLGWWSSNKSATAARESASASKGAVEIAKKAELRRGAPNWELEVRSDDDGGCVIVAVYSTGPPAVNLEIGYYGYFKGGAGNRKLTKLRHQTSRHEPVVKREPVELEIKRPEEWGSVEEVQINVTIISRSPAAKEDDGDWFDATHVRWRRGEEVAIVR